jgi:hypothetical protein
MRCLVGLVLFLVLYFGSCRVIGEVVAAMTLRSGQGYSRRGAELAAFEFVHTYHALIAVGAGALTLLACSLPTLLLKMGQREEWQYYAERGDRR